MCHILSSQHVDTYAYQTRSVRLGGHATSIKLEAAFWDILEEIAHVANMPLGKFLTEVHDEVLSLSGNVNNFTSLLRCACLTYVTEVRGKPNAAAILKLKTRRGFGAGIVAAE